MATETKIMDAETKDAIRVKALGGRGQELRQNQGMVPIPPEDGSSLRNAWLSESFVEQRFGKKYLNRLWEKAERFYLD